MPDKTEHTQALWTEAGPLSFCSELEEAWPNTNTVFIKKQRAYRPAGPALPHLPSAYLPPTRVPVLCVEVQNAWTPALPRTLSPCRVAGAELPVLSSLQGRLGSPPPGDVPASLPLASRPFQPLFMSLSVLRGRPRCQASFTQLPSSRDTMLASESLHWEQRETLSWQGFRAKSSFDTVRNSLPS